MLLRMVRWWSAQRVANATVIIVVLYVVLWALHPSLILSGTTITGGDTASHVAAPLYLKQHWGSGSLTSWDPGWFDGFPLYSYYFVLPDALAAAGSYLISYAVAFKLATILGSLLLPIGAFIMGKLFRAPDPIPAALAGATLPFLFDASFTIDGGNLFSTLAGEYSFSLSLALALITIGLFARGIRSNRGRWTAAVFLSLTLAAHLLPWMFVLGVVALLLVLELLGRRGLFDRERGATARHHGRRAVWFVVSSGVLSAGLSAWWLLPFASSQIYTNSMGYTNNPVDSFRAIFTKLGWYNAGGGAGGDQWVIALALVAVFAAFLWRDRLGITLTLTAVLAFLAYVLDPQSAIWNERLVPFWYISIFLSAGWFVGAVLVRVARSWDWWRRLFLRAILASGLGLRQFARQWWRVSCRFPTVGPRLEGWRARVVQRQMADGFWRARRDYRQLWWRANAGGAGPRVLIIDGEAECEDVEESARGAMRRVMEATFIVAALAMAVTVPGIVPNIGQYFGITPGANQVTNWANTNYSGLQAQTGWTEYHGLITTMQRVSKQYGCGRAMWEYEASQSRFGSTMSLMLLPYWTNSCVGSMEGLFFESSPTTPYHFLNQAELSDAPSNPMVGLDYGPYGQPDVTFGVHHLQMLGVRYYMAFSPDITAAANRDPDLVPVAVTQKWADSGETWHIYLIRHSDLVASLTSLPVVISGINAKATWLHLNESWYLDPRQWPTLLAADGPSNWPHFASTKNIPHIAVAPTTVGAVVVGDQSISFDVGTVGVPVLVKVSYYPRWHVSGALGPYRVSPNLMVVVPTSHHVVLQYGSSPAVWWGNLVTDIAVLALLVALWRRRYWRRPQRFRA